MPCPCRTVERSGDVEVVVVCLFEGTALCAQFLVSATRHRSHFSVDIPTTCCKRSISFHNQPFRQPCPPHQSSKWRVFTFPGMAACKVEVIVKTNGSFAALILIALNYPYPCQRVYNKSFYLNSLSWTHCFKNHG